ncbi:MAG TPA: hypothetical protein G4O02_01050 [Caldilineae bacterium]|nr:hypothetical protein [Caldilineae bacterium]
MQRIVNTRAFRPDPLPEEVVQELLWAFAYAPSMANTQSWEVIAVTERDVKERLVEATLDPLLTLGSNGAQGWLIDAPLVLAVLVDGKRARTRFGPRGSIFGQQDVAMAVQNLRLVALARGLASAWVREVDDEALRSVLNLPWYVEPAGLLALGYPADDVSLEAPPKLSPEEFLHWERWPGAEGDAQSAPPPRSVSEPAQPRLSGDIEKVMDVLARRRSIRAFTDDPLPEGWVTTLLRAATLAPSSGNMQAWEFIIVEDPRVKEKLVAATFTGYHAGPGNPQRWLAHAPGLIAVCVDTKRTGARYGPEGKRYWARVDGAIAVENMVIAATAMGLGTCLVGGFRPEEVAEALRLPEHVRPFVLLAVGYPAEHPPARPRLPLSDVTHRDRFDRPYFVGEVS